VPCARSDHWQGLRACSFLLPQALRLSTRTTTRQSEPPSPVRFVLSSSADPFLSFTDILSYPSDSRVSCTTPRPHPCSCRTQGPWLQGLLKVPRGGIARPYLHRRDSPLTLAWRHCQRHSVLPYASVELCIQCVITFFSDICF
jgi:hypothetical protein